MKRLLISLFLFPASLMAQQDILATTAQTSAALEPLSSSYLLKLTGGLILVVIVIFGLAWMVKKMNLTPRSQTGLIKVVAGLNLGTREKILLLEIGDEQIVVGLCPGRIEKLHTLTTPLNTDSIDVQAAGSMHSKFARKLNQLMAGSTLK
jgi:flagellar protein FliO/FliZ